MKNIIFYSVYNNIGNRDLDLLKVCIHSYNKTNNIKMKWVIFYFSSDIDLKSFNDNYLSIIFKKVKYYKNNLIFRNEIEKDFNDKTKLVDTFSYKIKCIEIFSKLKYDLICHVDFDVIFLKNMSKIYDYCLKIDNNIFGTLSYYLHRCETCWKDKSIFNNGYLCLGFTVFKPQKIYKEFINSKYLKSYIVDECFLSVYKNITDIKNLQLYKKNDIIDNYYILHLCSCGLTYNTNIFMKYYYKRYRKEVFESNASIEFKNFIKNYINLKN